MHCYKYKTALTTMNKALKIMALCALVMGTPITAMAEEMFDGPEIETTAITMVVNANTARISNAEGQTLEIYNLAGVKIDTYRIDSDEKTISLNKLPKGCYILKVGNVVRKVSIR